MAAMKQAITRVLGDRQSPEFWRQLVKKWEASGQTQSAVAKAAGVSVHTFQYWRAKLQAAEAGKPVKSSAFVEVAVSATPRSEATHCRIRIGDGVVVELSTLPPPAWVRALGGR